MSFLGHFLAKISYNCLKLKIFSLGQLRSIERQLRQLTVEIVSTVEKVEIVVTVETVETVGTVERVETVVTVETVETCDS